MPDFRFVPKLNCSVKTFRFKMLTLKQIVTQIRSKDWFVMTDLKDTYFHVSILPQHSKFLRLAFWGVSRVLKHFLPDLRSDYVVFHTDNTLVVSFIIQ